MYVCVLTESYQPEVFKGALDLMQYYVYMQCIVVVFVVDVPYPV